jgi:paraquat-inducible protein A
MAEMSRTHELIVCEYCDAVFRRSDLAKHQREVCLHCGGVLNRHVGLSVQQRLALSVTAAVLLLFANLYPVMSINLQGVSNSATLYDSVLILSSGPITFIALVAALAIIIAPTVQVTLLIWVLAFAVGGRRSPAFAFCMRGLEAMRPWSMLEVCLLGAMVAVIKLAGLLDVGLFALATLSILILAIAGRDIRSLWGLV